MDRGLVLSLVLHALALCSYIQTSATQQTGNLSAYKISSFQKPDVNTKLNHVILHSPSGNVYVGAVNSIYRLNNNLEHKSNISTTPECDDIGDCLNYNKVLFVEPGINALITCGSDTGKCELRHLEELTVISMIDTYVASDEDKTTVSVLAPGPENRDWLYVAATYTSSFPRNVKIPAVSRRDLDHNIENEKLLFANSDSIVPFNSDYKSIPFDINYVYGFSLNGYTYYVTAQQVDINNFNLISKVVRVCHQTNVPSPDLYAYTEITIQCGQGSSVYHLAQAAYVGPAGPSFATSLGIDPNDSMLYAVFANAKNDGTTGGNSALCAFRMTEIDEAFFTAVESCIRNNGDRVSYLEGSRCTTANVPDVTPYLCQTQFLYRFPNNADAVIATPLLELPGTRMSSVITSIEMNHTIAFIGTSSGTFLKVHIENDTLAWHYETIKLGDSPVLRDVILNDTMQQIHVLTEHQLLKLRVEDCNQYTSCETCIGVNGGQDGDPYCGWCTLEKSCTRQSECTMAEESSRWLPYNEIQCVTISDIAPYTSLLITNPQIMITVTVEQLPVLQLNQTYSCQFNDLSKSQGTTNGNTIECSIPEKSDRPTIPPLEDHVTLQLSVVSSETSVAFITIEFSFYECAIHTRCGECVTSNWACDWCVYDNKCTHQSTECTQGDNIITGNNNPSNGGNQGPDFCPQLQQQAGEELLPVEIPREILVHVSNLPNATKVTGYQCSLLIEGNKQTIEATQLSNDVIMCNSRRYTYAADDRNELIVPFTVIWNGDRELDDNYSFNVTLYKCNVDRRDCSRCLSEETARPELQCGWCGTQCAFNESSVCTSSTLSTGGQCPAPALETVFPTTGPIEGNTIIEVMGTNIGQRFQDVTNVTVGQQSCDLTGLKNQYITAQRVRCRTAPMSVGATQDITVYVARVDGSGDLPSTQTVQFTYKDPMITSFSPMIGPEAGRTLVTINGTNMDVGRDVKAMVDMNIPCEITSITNTAIQCRTGNSTAGNTGLISVTFDGALRSSTEAFTYQLNPNVTDVQPRKSIRSGGRSLNVTGLYFEQIQNPRIIIKVGDSKESFTESCTVVNDVLMTCTTPKVTTANSASRNSGNRKKRQASSDTVSVGFIMADVTCLLTWSNDVENFECLVVNDPKFNQFSEEGNIHQLDGSKLQITGSDLNAALTKEELIVFVGEEQCEVEVLDSTILTCTPPEIEPAATDFNKTATNTSVPAVYIQIRNIQLNFFIGYLRYVTVIEIGLYIGIAAGVVLLPLFLLAVFLWRKLRGSQKEISEILLQMDEVERGMAEDLRIAFAELQTNVTDLTHDLAGTGMPFVSHRQYATNMLFVGLDIQPLSYDPPNTDETIERAMAQFNKLLVNKGFLFAFIQALDDDKKISIKDKSTIASLLTVVMMLENRLGYLTDIMITLMSRQVQEAVDNNRPKQLFRRTESIVEKLLSNWIALCLYDQLQDRTAFPLFLLYSGIKVQTEKGPVDAITRQAHFSLSEERLLRGSVEFKEMSLHVVVDSEDGEKEVRVLDVDAIPQVKEKILDSMYRNKPYSDRQRAMDVSLEWRKGKTGRLVLQDVAFPQMTLTECKERENLQKLNTLQELGIPDNSSMALVPKQTLHTSINEATSGYGPTDVSIYHRDIEQESGSIIWHLENPQEDVEESEKQKKKRQREFALGKGNKKSRDITFPRLLTMKGIIQEYVDNMFQAILTVQGTPLAIKYLFDFFDSQASRHDIEDPDIVHIWKSNTFPLRFWVSSITHPNYIFDIRPTPSVESSLGVVGQAFYDACNKSDHQLGWESSVNKLLYNREVNKYRGFVESYYEGIAEMDRITNTQLESELDKTCKNFTGVFSKLSTLMQLYNVANCNKDLLLNAMDQDEICEGDSLAFELEQIDIILHNE